MVMEIVAVIMAVVIIMCDLLTLVYYYSGKQKSIESQKILFQKLDFTEFQWQCSNLPIFQCNNLPMLVTLQEF